MNLSPFVCSVLVASVALSGAAESVPEQPLQMAAPAASPVAVKNEAFHQAALECLKSYRHDASAIQALLQQGADVNAVDAEGNNVLMLLIKATDGHSEYRIRKELFELLRDAGINLHARNKAGMNAAELNCCLYHPSRYLTTEFDKAGVPIHSGARLAAAAALCRVDEVERLLQQNADPNYNRACGLLQCMGILTDGPNPNEVIVAALLLEAGADPNLSGASVMSRAVHSDYADQLVPLLLDHGFRVRDYKAEQHSWWMEHLLGLRHPARIETANLLICHGAELNDATWYAPYFCRMVKKGNGSYADMMLARHLIELGMDATRRDESGKTAYMLAREKKLGLGIQQILANPQAVLAELQQKAQAVDESGRTQLMLAVADPHQPAIEVYKWLRAEVDVNARDAQGRTALFYINSFCPQKTLKAKLLIEAGADVDARDAQGRTPLLALPYIHDLRIPQQQSCVPIIQLLAQAGADLNAHDNDGLTRLEQMLRRGDALSSHDKECVNLLRNLGCTPRPEAPNK